MTDQRGFVAIELPVAVVLILFVPAIVLGTVIAVVERLSVAEKAASNAVTELVGAASLDSGIELAHSTVARVGINNDLSAERLSLTDVRGEFRRGETMKVEVTVSMPALSVPFIGAIEGWSKTVGKSARIDDYRSFG